MSARVRLLLTVWLLAASVAAGEQAPELTIEIRPGFAGLYKQGSALPVQVGLENRGEDLSGRLSIELGGVRVTQEISLPVPSRKLYYLELPAAPWEDELAVELTASGFSTRRTAAVRPLPPAARLMVMASGRVPRPAASAVSRDSASRWLASVDASALPERWSGYQGLSGLILDGAAAGHLSPARQQALSDWLLLGGRLAILAPRPERLRPVLLDWPMRPLGLDPTAAEPIDFAWGRGVVRLGQPIESVTAEGLAAVLPGPPTGPPPALASDSPSRAAPAAGIRPRPAPLLIVLSLLYLVAVVAVASLGRFGSPVVRWQPLALFGVVALFSLGSGGLGRLVNGGGLLLEEEVTVHVFADADQAFLVGRSRYLAARRGEVELTAELQRPLLEAAESAGRQRYRLAATGGAVVLRTAPWARGEVHWRGFADPGFRLLTRRPGEPRIVNRSSSTLVDCRGGAGRETDPPVRIAPGGELPLGGSLAPAGGPLLACILEPAPRGLRADGPATRPAARATVVFHPVPGTPSFEVSG